MGLFSCSLTGLGYRTHYQVPDSATENPLLWSIVRKLRRGRQGVDKVYPHISPPTNFREKNVVFVPTWCRQ